MEEKSLKPESKGKLFFIINDTNEKFTFKWFKDEQFLKEYFEHIDNPDVFEDISFSVSNNI
jgi:hypothetical protein